MPQFACCLSGSSSSRFSAPVEARFRKCHEVVPLEPVPARTIVSPKSVPARTEPTSVEPQPPVIDAPASLGLEILSPPAPPLIIIPDDSFPMTQLLIRQALESVVFHLLAKPICWLSERSLSATLRG
ncbi:hypothetical protein GmHk_20G057143 [Glycine max]|nr:hypothetical protein GmHk_20G057143 [Glycine max]